MTLHRRSFFAALFGTAAAAPLVVKLSAGKTAKLAMLPVTKGSDLWASLIIHSALRLDPHFRSASISGIEVHHE